MWPFILPSFIFLLLLLFTCFAVIIWKVENLFLDFRGILWESRLFCRVKGVNKKYTWKKQGFTTVIPKQNPCIRYITANCYLSASKARKVLSLVILWWIGRRGVRLLLQWACSSHACHYESEERWTWTLFTLKWWKLSWCWYMFAWYCDFLGPYVLVHILKGGSSNSDL